MEGRERERERERERVHKDTLWNYGTIPYDIEANFTGQLG